MKNYRKSSGSSMPRLSCTYKVYKVFFFSFFFYSFKHLIISKASRITFEKCVIEFLMFNKDSIFKKFQISGNFFMVQALKGFYLFMCQLITLMQCDGDWVEVFLRRKNYETSKSIHSFMFSKAVHWARFESLQGQFWPPSFMFDIPVQMVNLQPISVPVYHIQMRKLLTCIHDPL